MIIRRRHLRSCSFPSSPSLAFLASCASLKYTGSRLLHDLARIVFTRRKTSTIIRVICVNRERKIRFQKTTFLNSVGKFSVEIILAVYQRYFFPPRCRELREKILKNQNTR